MLAVPLLASPALAACNDDTEPPREAAAVSTSELTLEAEHLGRIHVAAFVGGHGPRGATLAVEARFAAFRGLDLDEAAVRASVPPLWAELLSPGECVALPRTTRGEGREPEPGSERELSLLDAGDLRVTLGDLEQVLPMVLVPDLVPWVSGVEYAWTSQAQRDGLAGPSRADDEPLPVRIEATGGDVELPAFALQTTLPSPVELTADDGPTPTDAFALSWSRGDADETMLLEFSSQRTEQGQPTVACRVEDEGRATISRSTLASAGLRLDGPVQIVARRQRVERAAVGAFDAVEVVAESTHALSVDDR